MKKSFLKIIPILLILIFILSACGTTGPLTENPNDDLKKLETQIKEKDVKIAELEYKIEEQKDKVKELETDKETNKPELKPGGEKLSPDEAQDLLNEWYEWNQVFYIPDLAREDEGVRLYGFLLDYSNKESQWSGDTYCYAWVNSTTGLIDFQEAGYSQAHGTNFYTNIPDSIFPIPMRDGIVISYDKFTPPDYAWGVAYTYRDKSVMENYQAQLEEAGFVDLGTVQSVESLWKYQGDDTGPTLTVEMYSEEETFAMTMYIND